jgi:hypothetical protein
MKTWSMLAAVLVLGFCASLVMAEGAEHKQNMVRGKVTKIEGASITVQPRAMGEGKAPEAKTFTTDDKTVVVAGKQDGEKKAVSDIKVEDTIVAVLTEDGSKATKIVLNPTGGKKGGGDRK